VPTVVGQRARWLSNRDAIERSGESRQFVDDLLGELASRRFVPSAWGDFIARSLLRAVKQARKHPTAAAEVTAIHLLVAATGSRLWTFVSWSLCITHLGLLGERQALGWPNRLTLLRALLPVLAPASRWTSMVALATDVGDGLMARRGEESAFGAYADPIADGAFWSWYALRWEPNRCLRWVPITLFAASVAGISVAYFAHGRSIDYPRPVSIRYASAVCQVLLALRSLRPVATGGHRTRGLRRSSAR
jgi:phosphatidylglycerophosphate synthase